MNALGDQYNRRHQALLVPLAEQLDTFLKKHFATLPRVDRISARAKSVDRFLQKAAKFKPDGTLKYIDPLNQIQDQVGARIAVLYKSDVVSISAEVERYFKPIESKTIVPDSEKEFDYFGKHFILFIPRDLALCAAATSDGLPFFELQVKTVFQHAWSEAEHDLGYKPTHKLTPEQRRKIAFTAAQAWGADMVFDELHLESAKAASTGH